MSNKKKKSSMSMRRHRALPAFLIFKKLLRSAFYYSHSIVLGGLEETS